MSKRKERGASTETALLCIQCPDAEFPEPRSICYKTGGLYCKRLDELVGKYDRCRLTEGKDMSKDGSERGGQ